MRDGETWLVERVLAEVTCGLRVVVGCRELPGGPYVLVREVINCLGEAGFDAGPALAAVEAASGDGEYGVCRAVRELLVAPVPPCW